MDQQVYAQHWQIIWKDLCVCDTMKYKNSNSMSENEQFNCFEKKEL